MRRVEIRIMNNKGQVTIGLLVMVFVLVIVGVALLQPTAVNVDNLRTLQEQINNTFATGAIGTTAEIEGSGISGEVIAINESGDVVPVTNYTARSRQPPITSGVVSNTLEIVGLSAASQNLNLSYTAEPDGYDTSAGGRAIILLVVIFFALAIGVIALIPAARSGVMEMFNG